MLAETLRLEVVAIPVTAQGPDLGYLQSLCRRRPVRAVYSMPTLHNPLGWVMSQAQREQLVEVARQHNLMIIEDAAYAFLVQDAPPPVAQLEAQKREDAQARQALAAQVLSRLDCISHPSSYFLWLPLAEDVRADQVAMTLQREKVWVSTAEPFAVSAHVPHALRLALGSVEMPALREALATVRRVVAW